MGVVAIFGGTFNPIHKGHTEILEHLSAVKEIDTILLIPTKFPPHKESPYLADGSHRMAMCEIIAKKFSKVVVSDIELKREGKSYTIDTIKDVKKLYPDSDIAITIGADMTVTFTEWKNYLELLKTVKIYTFGRVGIDNDKFLESIDYLSSLGGNIELIDKKITDISSTQLRNTVAEYPFVSGLIDKDVYNYMKLYGLYGV